LRSVAGSISYARELLEYEFKETERLETRIARQTRHCAELKAMHCDVSRDLALFLAAIFF